MHCESAWLRHSSIAATLTVAVAVDSGRLHNAFSQFPFQLFFDVHAL